MASNQMLKAHFQHLQAECRRLHFVRTSGLLPFVGACKWLQNFVRAPGLVPMARTGDCTPGLHRCNGRIRHTHVCMTAATCPYRRLYRRPYCFHGVKPTARGKRARTGGAAVVQAPALPGPAKRKELTREPQPTKQLTGEPQAGVQAAALAWRTWQLGAMRTLCGSSGL